MTIQMNLKTEKFNVTFQLIDFLEILNFGAIKPQDSQSLTNDWVFFLI